MGPLRRVLVLSFIAASILALAGCGKRSSPLPMDALPGATLTPRSGGGAPQSAPLGASSALQRTEKLNLAADSARGVIHYLKEEKGEAAFYAINPDGSDRRKVGGPVPDVPQRWDLAKDFVIFQGQSGTVYTAAADGTTPLNLDDYLPERLLHIFARRDADSAFLGLYRKADAAGVLLQVGKDGKHRVVHTFNPVPSVVLAAGDRTLMVIQKADATWEVHYLDFPSHSVRRLAQGRGEALNALTSADNRFLVLNTVVGGVPQGFVVDVRSGRAFEHRSGHTIWPLGDQIMAVRQPGEQPEIALAPPDDPARTAPWEGLIAAVQKTAPSGSQLRLEEINRSGGVVSFAGSDQARLGHFYALFPKTSQFVYLGAQDRQAYVHMGAAGAYLTARAVAQQNRLVDLKMVTPAGVQDLFQEAVGVAAFRTAAGLVVNGRFDGSVEELGLVAPGGYKMLMQDIDLRAAHGDEGKSALVVSFFRDGALEMNMIDLKSLQIMTLDDGGIGAEWVD